MKEKITLFVLVEHLDSHFRTSVAPDDQLEEIDAWPIAAASHFSHFSHFSPELTAKPPLSIP